MATTATQFNAATTAYMVLWQDYLDSLTLSAPVGGRVRIYFPPSGYNRIALDTGAFPHAGFNATGTGDGCLKYVYQIPLASSTTNMIYEIPGLELGRVPLFFKVATGTTDAIADS